MDRENIYEKVKNARTARLLNNCYSMDSIEKCSGLWAVGDSFLFSHEDHGIQRLTYFVKDWKSLEKLIKQIDEGVDYLEFMTKEPGEYIPQKAEKSAALMRLANPDCRSVFEKDSPVFPYCDPDIGEQAKEKDAEEINRILWGTFHTEISHLLTNEEIKERIDQFLIHREDGEIDALLQADVMPKKFYINQIINHGEKKNIHAMLLNRLKNYISNGGKYLYAWVEDTNIASQKFHAKYGMKHDGMWNMIYRIER